MEIGSEGMSDYAGILNGTWADNAYTGDHTTTGGEQTIAPRGVEVQNLNLTGSYEG